MQKQDKRVLIVESRSEVLLELRGLVTGAGYRPIAAMGMEEALVLLSNLSPYAVLLGQLESTEKQEILSKTNSAKIPTISIPNDLSKLTSDLRSMLSSVSTEKSSEKETSTKEGGGMVTKLLDELAIALADEVADRDDLLAFRTPSKAILPPQEEKIPSFEEKSPSSPSLVKDESGPRLSLVSQKESSENLEISDEVQTLETGSDGVTQILGALAKSLGEPKTKPKIRVEKPIANEEKTPDFILPSQEEDSSPEIAASLFDLAVGGGDNEKEVEKKVITRVARPQADDIPTPPNDKPTGDFVKSALFTPVSMIEERPISPVAPPPVEERRANTPLPPLPEEEAPAFSSSHTKPPPIVNTSVRTTETKPKLQQEDTSENQKQNHRGEEIQKPFVPIDTPAKEELFLPPKEPSLPLQLLKNARKIHELFVEKETGVFRVQTKEGSRSLFLFEGKIAAFASEITSDQITTLLFKEGKLTRKQWEESLSWIDYSTKDLSQLLYQKGYIKRAEFEEITERQREEIIAGLLEGEATFQTKPSITAPREEPPLLSQFLLNAVRRRLGVSQARLLLCKATLCRSTCSACSLESLSLSEKEQNLLSKLDGMCVLQDLQTPEYPEALLLPFLVGLEILGLVRIIEAKEPEVDIEDERKIDRARIENKYEQVVLYDYFELLGVSRRATLYEIQQSHQNLTTLFSLEKYRDPYFSDLLPHLEEIQEVLEDALSVLSDDILRQSYLENLIGD